MSDFLAKKGKEQAKKKSLVAERTKLQSLRPDKRFLHGQ